MLIFDNFPNEERAQAFMAAIKNEFELETHLCRHDEEGRLFDVNTPHGEPRFYNGDPSMPLAPKGMLDVFPFTLTAPIVCVERPHNDGLLDVTDEKELRKQISNRLAEPESDANVEVAIEERVAKYGGVFAGT